MLTKFKTILAVITLWVLSSCEPIRDSYDDCGVWLEFFFDYNMEYADAFDPQVRTVDVYVFDEAGKYIFTKHAGIDDLQDRKRMFLDDDLPFGNYKILTVGNLSEYFRFTGRNGSDLVPGFTTIEQAMLALNTESASQEFAHLWFGTTVKVDYRANLSIWKAPLIRETNKFNILLQTLVTTPGNNAQGPVNPIHTVEIVAPEFGAYNYLNNPTDPHPLVYRPYSLLSRLDFMESGVLQETAAKINTMRLLENEWNGYRIIIRHKESGEELWNNDLLSLLAATKPAYRPDGTDLPRAEYFDREGEWNIVIVYRRGSSVNPNPIEPDKAFVALKIVVNGWIIWEHPMGV